MREIKFKGKRIDNREWVYGDLLQGCELCCEISDCNSIDGTRYEIDENTIGQYTCLKDKNGVEIYEGDIVKINDEIIAKVIWDKDYLGYFLYADEKNGIDYFENGEQPLYDYWGSIEVIGNIYDNPELLEKEVE